MSTAVRRLATAFGGVLVLGLSGCETVRNVAVAGSSPINWNGLHQVVLPLSRDSSGRPVVPVHLEGVETPTIFDSGGGGFVLEPALAERLGLTPREREKRVNELSVKSLETVAIRIGGISMDVHLPVLADLPSSSEALMGAHVFLQAVIDLDFDTGEATVIHPDAFTPPEGMRAVPVRMQMSRPTVNARLNGDTRPFCAVLDTGFNGFVAVTDRLVADYALPTAPGEGVSIGLGGARVQRPRLANLRTFEFGGLDFSNVQVANISRDRSCETLIGMGLLSRHRVIFDIPHRKVWFGPRAPR